MICGFERLEDGCDDRPLAARKQACGLIGLSLSLEELRPKRRKSALMQVFVVFKGVRACPVSSIPLSDSQRIALHAEDYRVRSLAEGKPQVRTL
jgi:hypothetical protein